ncbi:MAG: hypothetical protein IKW64_05900 [Clostridia bacterium]|nr:hypothetical protein [Clostridia bacterium]
MTKDKYQLKYVAEKNKISYFIVSDEGESARSFGIKLVTSGSEADSASAENLFFTECEAESFCKFMAENEVYPCTLHEVLTNMFSF